MLSLRDTILFSEDSAKVFARSLSFSCDGSFGAALRCNSFSNVENNIRGLELLSLMVSAQNFILESEISLLTHLHCLTNTSLLIVSMFLRHILSSLLLYTFSALICSLYHGAAGRILTTCFLAGACCSSNPDNVLS